MAIRRVELTSEYVVGAGMVHLTAVIGQGQAGSTLVTVGERVFEQERTFDRDLGLGPDLKGMTIDVFSVVTDTNLQTNMTTVTYRLTGGPVPLVKTASLVVEQERESVDYHAIFRLV